MKAVVIRYLNYSSIQQLIYIEFAPFRGALGDIECLIIKKRKLVRCRDQPNNSRDTMHNMTLI